MSSADVPALRPGQVIGILGGGQLGRMLGMAAARLGLRTHVYDPQEACPAADVCGEHTVAAFEDQAAMARFAAAVDAITFEWESVPIQALAALERTPPVRPRVAALTVLQDRLSEKRFLTELGLQTAPFEELDTPDQLQRALDRVGTPAIVKTRRFGYDGKGQARIMGPDDVAAALALVAQQPCILEGFVHFEREVSVIAARAVDGSRACYDPSENTHEEGILRRTRVPATLSAALREEAFAVAASILDGLDYVGVLGVEFFVTDSGLLVNEVAPRVHNSGHWTQEGCQVDQFEQHIRAVAGWPLGSTERHTDVTMVNLIGDDVQRWAEYLGTKRASLHLYGKVGVRAGRKMGHVNLADGPSLRDPSAESASAGSE
ncbi:MAG: 5-(carboxyamino)imidazole ribonucleotide synthase [Myxococcales bacterium]|nr:5-(carboxyamino)imidazole ribonucleotide synthase [Myxococcales bacterium]MCB9630011.1 5-(carboxyamino)imidazole ribonucleotide synthase [Sandaracinaceae bacterium]